MQCSAHAFEGDVPKETHFSFERGVGLSPDSSFRERPIKRVEFRPIKSKRPRSQNSFSIGSHTIETGMLFSDISFGPYSNVRHYLAPVYDYRRSVAVGSSTVARAADVYVK
ncbi:hypothetical protein EVAR_64330_1 [Eumeta japonica]|uniref:Uncharacterized protein n=1 Tax=Eumeta variegata TaxID=151549 RepID=A0A4C1Z829_EUMVA|nr:hypothetical protein EVAR_64330_1 [Eumeta japonica]